MLDHGRKIYPHCCDIDHPCLSSFTRADVLEPYACAFAPASAGTGDFVIGLESRTVYRPWPGQQLTLASMCLSPELYDTKPDVVFCDGAETSVSQSRHVKNHTSARPEALNNDSPTFLP